MNWFILIVAGLFEIGWAVGLKYTEGFTRPLPTLLTVGAMITSTNWRSTMCEAVVTSSSRLKAMMPPKADSVSVSKARS